MAAKVKSFFGGAKLDRAKLAALGTSALLAYGASQRASGRQQAPQQRRAARSGLARAHLRQGFRASRQAP